MSGKKAKKQQRKALEAQQEAHQLHRALEYVHGKAAVEVVKEPLKRKIRKRNKKRIKKLANQLRKQNKFLPSDVQYGICTLTGGVTQPHKTWA